MAVTSSNSLSVAIAHAISYLTRPLIPSYSATTIIKLQLVLEANFTALYAPTWVPKEPLRNSGRRCLTLSPACLPPRPIYSACIAAEVQWFDWIAKLGGREFDFLVDPGCISVRFGKKGAVDSQLITVWADEIPSPVAATSRASHLPITRNSKPGKTLAQQLLEEDTEEDDQLFAMIADEISAPTWMTPVLDHFPLPGRSSSPLSTISSHSRSSSRSSNSSSGFSFASGGSSGTTTSMSTSGSYQLKGEPKQSRRERAKQAHVFVDTSKTEVTPYDGGKTTVLTGGVMLGGGAKAKKPSVKPQSTILASSWRSARA